MATREEIGRRIREARTSANLSQQAVADATDIERSAISDVENGKRNVTALELLALAKVLGRSVGWIVGEEQDPPAIEADAPRALAELLVEATANIDRHVACRAEEIGAAIGMVHAKVTAAKIRAKDAELQRAHAQIRSLEKYLKLRDGEREGRIEAQKRLMNVRTCKVWIDDLGREFVFCDELWHATDPELHPVPVPVRIERTTDV